MWELFSQFILKMYCNFPLENKHVKVWVFTSEESFVPSYVADLTNATRSVNLISSLLRNDAITLAASSICSQIRRVYLS